MISQPERLAQQDMIEQTWSDGFCTTDWCKGERWMVRRDDRHHELWLVAASVEDSAWEIASDVPICPFCGTHLLSHIEAVGEVPGAADNALADYTRRLAA